MAANPSAPNVAARTPLAALNPYLMNCLRFTETSPNEDKTESSRDGAGLNRLSSIISPIVFSPILLMFRDVLVLAMFNNNRVR